MFLMEGSKHDMKGVWNYVTLFVILLAVQLTTTQSELNVDGLLYTTQGKELEVTERITRNEDQATIANISADSCELPQEESKKLDETLQKASVDFIVMADNDSKNNPQNLCFSLVAYINNQANYMLQQAKLLTEVALEDRKTFKILKEGYQVELLQFAAILDSLNKEEITTIKTEFSSKFMQFQININDSLNKLKTLIVLKREAVFKLCVSQIQKGEYKSALASFKKLNDNSQLTKMVIHAYGGVIENLSNVIKFIKIADSCDHQALAYDGLFDVIKTDNYLSNPNMLYFADLIEECVNVSLKHKLEEFKTMIIKGLIYEYNLEKTYEALEFEKKFPSNEASIKFTIYSTLLDEMEKNDHLNTAELIALASRVKILDQFCERNRNECKYIQPKLSKMRQRFPNALKALMFKPYTIIESKIHQGYTLYGSTSGEVNTAPNINSSNHKWLVRPVADSSRFIELENLLTGGKMNVRESQVHIGSNYDLACQWQIIPEGSTGFYYLKNRVNSEMLDANNLRHCSWSGTSLCSQVYTHDLIDGNDFQLWKFS